MSSRKSESSHHDGDAREAIGVAPTAIRDLRTSEIHLDTSSYKPRHSQISRFFIPTSVLPLSLCLAHFSLQLDARMKLKMTFQIKAMRVTKSCLRCAGTYFSRTMHAGSHT